MPENAAVRRAPDESCVIKAIMVIADSGLVWPRHRTKPAADVRSAMWPHAWSYVP